MKEERPAWLLPTPARRDEPAAGAGLRAFVLRLMRGENLNRAEAASLLDALLEASATDARRLARCRMDASYPRISSMR